MRARSDIFNAVFSFVSTYFDKHFAFSAVSEEATAYNAEDYKERLNRLIRFNQTLKVYTCAGPGCNHFSANKATVVNHIEAVHLQILRYDCTFCERTFFNKDARRKHLARQHGSEMMRNVFNR